MKKDNYEITETDLKQAKLEGIQECISMVYQRIKKGDTTGQICCLLDVQIDIYNDRQTQLQEIKDKELGL